MSASGSEPTTPVHLSTGLPETVLPATAPDLAAALAAAGDDRAAMASVAARWPRSTEVWGRLGSLARDEIEAYAYFRVGYHRGLDSLRANGWRGSGYVRWRHVSNQGFLSSLEGLRAMAATIGEEDEAERCAQFLLQLDPDWIRRTR